MKSYIKGRYDKDIYKSDNGFTVGLFKLKETNDEEIKDYINRTITFTGYFPGLNHGDDYIMYGKPLDHPRYGFQYSVEVYEKLKPTDKEGIVEFLSSDLFPGIGKSIAESIFQTLGKNALDDILVDPSCLNLVPKLSQAKADTIYSVLKKYEDSQKTLVYLNDIGFSTKESMLIYSLYNKLTLDLVKNNIYKIIRDLPNITFEKVDNIALNMGVEKNDKKRLEAIIIYVMNNLVYKNSDCYLKKNIIEKEVLKYATIDNFDKLFNDLEDQNQIVIENDDYYLKEIWDSETYVVQHLKELINKPVKEIKNLDALIKKLEKKSKITYNDKQITAIKKSLENNILIITGGPGTGKTTIIKAITTLYKEVNKLSYDALIKNIALLAPTGRASKRMGESTSLPSSTIHRFLKYDGQDFMVNEDKKDHSKFIILDEVSMIDINLMANLLRGLTSNIQLILVGDYNQLPSVGPGQVLKDLIESNIIDTVYLDELYRQDENSYIPFLAEEIRKGSLSSTYLETKSDYTFLKCSSHYIKKNLENLCNQIKNKNYSYKQIQLLAPMYMGENGIDALNITLQDIFNPKNSQKNEVKYGTITYRENDKVLQLVNMPEYNIYNGDIGVINSITGGKEKEILIDFDGNLVSYKVKDLNKIKHGFIISIHKSQGSEFEIVVMPICLSYGRMLYRKLIYTAITRAKRKLIIIGEPDAFVKSIKNDREYNRNSKLLEKITYKIGLDGK